jgi:hypothetical protein
LAWVAAAFKRGQIMKTKNILLPVANFFFFENTESGGKIKNVAWTPFLRGYGFRLEFTSLSFYR